MLRSQRLKGWGIVIALLLGTIGIAPFAGGAGADGIQVNMKDVPFDQLVQCLVQKDEGKKVEMLDILSTPVTVVVTTPTSVGEILANLCKANGMDLRLENDTYIIKKHESGTANPQPSAPRVDPAPVVNLSNDPLPSVTPPQTTTANPEKKASEHSVIQMITLNNMSVGEVCWLLGVNGAVRPDAERRHTLDNRMKTMFDGHKPTINADDLGGNYASPMLGSVRMGYPDNATGQSSMTDANQVFGGVNPGVVNPGVVNPGVVNPTTNPNGTVTTNGTTNTNGTNTNQTGQLRNFIPDGVEAIVGIGALNQLLVRAKDPAQIQQLADFLKLIDRPTKQVVVEMMFVDMTVEDAFAMGSSFQIAGAPFFVENQGTSTNGNFSVMYTQGNIQMQLATLLTKKRAKVISSPRVVVQNNGTASIQTSVSFPQLMTSQQTDIYGRITSVPSVTSQSFTNGITVGNATILPDNSVILNVTPMVSNPANGISIPGDQGTGQLQGANQTTVQAIVRIKNGETMMMGGVVSENVGDTARKIPLLSDIPVLGPLLFTSTINNKSNEETMFFLTPTIIMDDKTNFDGMTNVPPVF